MAKRKSSTLARRLIPLLLTSIALTLVMAVPTHAANLYSVIGASQAWNDVTFLSSSVDFSYRWESLYSQTYPYKTFAELIPDNLSNFYVQSGAFSSEGRFLVGQMQITEPVPVLGDYVLVLGKTFTLSPGQSMQFFIMPTSNKLVSATDGSEVFFNELNTCVPGYMSTMGFQQRAGLTFHIDKGVSDDGYNVFRITFSSKTENTEDIDISAIMFRFSTYNAQYYSGYCTFRTAFSNVLIYTGSDLVPFDPQLGQLSGQIGTIDDKLGNVNDKLDDIEDILTDDSSKGEVPDYGAITGDPSYDVGDLVGEDEAVAELSKLQDDVDLLLLSADFSNSLDFWQQIFNLIYNVPAILSMVSVSSMLLVFRALLGR